VRGERTVDEVISLLFSELPALHRSTAGEAFNWAIQRPVLEWLAAHVGKEDSTLETGVGYSTIVLAAAGARHVAIAPSQLEQRVVRDWCRKHDVSLETVTFHTAPSQIVLPQMPATPLDLVLIDGAHAFPFPYIDWYYTADRLKLRGYLLIDDTQLRTVAILREFLLLETGRWELIAEFGKTAVFRKLSSEVFSLLHDWPAQPFCSSYRPPKPPLPLRARVRRLPVLGVLLVRTYRAVRRLLGE
jgi:hypothetical protein